MPPAPNPAPGAFPAKIDFHRHLEGSHTARALSVTAAARGLRIEPFFDTAANRFRSAEELAPRLRMQGPPGDSKAFYASIEAARRAYVDLDALELLSFESFVDSAAEVDALEMRVSLFSMTRTLLGAEWRNTAPAVFAERARETLLRVLAARDRAQAVTGKRLLVRVGFSRTFESEAHYAAMGERLVEHADAVCGLDVLGILPPPDKEPLQPALVAILERCRRAIPDLTIHAGEFDDHASVQRALALSPQGIGHGVRSVGSDTVMATLAASGVTLETCPTSNELLIPHELAELRQRHSGRHPISVLQAHQVRAVLGSDDPVCMGTRFPDEWRHALAAGVDEATLVRDSARRWAQLQ